MFLNMERFFMSLYFGISSVPNVKNIRKKCPIFVNVKKRYIFTLANDI